ncbi:hypothetical protein T08_12887 [Trichinella sp. T8]|nr:hypothetical protein T08_12887 [Trichinella sp. T8]
MYGSEFFEFLIFTQLVVALFNLLAKIQIPTYFVLVVVGCRFGGGDLRGEKGKEVAVEFKNTLFT